jgi:DNA-binding CsgD family transcriptional regulator
MLEEARTLYAAEGDTANVVHACHVLAWVALSLGDPAQATALGEQALRLAQELDDAILRGEALEVLGLACCARSDWRHAAPLLAKSLSLYREGASQPGLARSLANAAVVAVAIGELEPAARLFGAAETTGLASGYRFRLPQRAAYERAMASARASLGDADFVAALAGGQALPLDEGIAEAMSLLLRQGGQAAAVDPRGQAERVGLTDRELAVLRLLAEGKADKEIAAALGIARATVAKHGQAIRAKLGLPSRTAVVAQAVRHGLV